MRGARLGGHIGAGEHVVGGRDKATLRPSACSRFTASALQHLGQDLFDAEPAGHPLDHPLDGEDGRSQRASPFLILLLAGLSGGRVR